MKQSSIDKLGRIVIPIQFRKELGIDEATPLSISLEDGAVVLRPKQSVCPLCKLSFKEEQALPICKSCVKRIKELELP